MLLGAPSWMKLPEPSVPPEATTKDSSEEGPLGSTGLAGSEGVLQLAGLAAAAGVPQCFEHCEACFRHAYRMQSMLVCLPVETGVPGHYWQASCGSSRCRPCPPASATQGSTAATRSIRTQAKLCACAGSTGREAQLPSGEHAAGVGGKVQGEAGAGAARPEGRLSRSWGGQY